MSRRGSNRPKIAIVNGVWWCLRCHASGFTPSRPKHYPRCGKKRPITWSPPPMITSQA